jgi:hypothetical protein
MNVLATARHVWPAAITATPAPADPKNRLEPSLLASIPASRLNLTRAPFGIALDSVKPDRGPDVNSLEVVHSGPIVNADVAKLQ